MYKKVEVELKFRDRIYSGLPKNSELIKGYVKAKFGSEDSTTVETDLDLDNELEKVTTGFKKDDVGIYIGSYQIKAALKQYASLLRFTVKKRGSKQTVAEGLFIKGINADDNLTNEKIYLLPLKTTPDGIHDHTGNVPTPQGTRSILKALEYIEKPTVKFQVWVIDVRIGKAANSKDLRIEDIRTCLEFGQECGIGAHRAYESGKFDIIKFEEIPEEK
jgi:hypothetical protein